MDTRYTWEERDLLLQNAHRLRIPVNKIAKEIGVANSTLHNLIRRRGGSRTKLIDALDAWLRENIEPRMAASNLPHAVREGVRVYDHPRAMEEYDYRTMRNAAMMLAMQVIDAANATDSAESKALQDNALDTAKAIIELDAAQKKMRDKLNKENPNG